MCRAELSPLGDLSSSTCPESPPAISKSLSGALDVHAATMPSPTLALLGPPLLARADGADRHRSLRKELALLAYLAVEDRGVQRRDTLLGLLWPDARGSQRRATVCELR